MSDEQNARQNNLVPSGEHGLATQSAGLAKRGLELATTVLQISSSFEFVGHTEAVESAVFSTDGQFVLSGGYDKTIRIWDVQNRNQVHCFHGHTGAVNCVAFSPDGHLVISGSDDGTIRLWNIPKRQEIRRFEGHTSHVQSIDCSSSGYIVSGGRDKTVRLWQLEHGQQARSFEWNKAMTPIKMNRVVFSSDGLSVLGCGDGYEFFLWNTKSGLQVRSFGPILGGVVTNVAISPNGSYIVSCHREVALWDVSDGKCIRTFKIDRGWILDAAISPDNCVLLAAGEDGLVRLLDINTGEELHRFIGHTGAVKSIRFSPNGRYAVSASQDKTIRVWKI